MSGAEQPISAHCLLGRAAKGDVDALRQLALSGYQIFKAEVDSTALIEALVFARLAAAVGDVDDIMRLVTMLSDAWEGAQADPEQFDWGESLAAELLALSSRLADAGVACADDLMVKVSGRTGPLAAASAKSIVNLIPLMSGAI